MAAGTGVLMSGGGLHLEGAELPVFRSPGLRGQVFSSGSLCMGRPHLEGPILVLQVSEFFVSLFVFNKCLSHGQMCLQVPFFNGKLSLLTD